MQQLQNIPRLNMNMIRHLCLPRNSCQQLPQIGPVGHRADLIGNTVNVGYDLQLFLFVNADGKIQHQLQSDAALLPVKIRPHRQLLLSQAAANIRKHTLPAAMAFQRPAERNGSLKRTDGMLFPFSLIKDKHMHIPGQRNLFFHDLKIQIPDGRVIPQNLKNIGVIGRQADFLFQPENIVLADGNLRHLQRHPAVFRFFVSMDRYRRFLVIEFLHLCRQGNQGLYIQLPGVYHACCQVFYLPVHTHIVRRHHSPQIDSFIKRYPSLQCHKAAAFLLRMIKHHIRQIPAHIDEIRAGADFFDDDLSLFQIQRVYVRPAVRYIQVILQCKLCDRLRFHAVHMYVSFYQLHKNTSAYILV